MDLKYKWLQISVMITGFLGTTLLSLMYLSPLIYLFSMAFFTIFNILQMIHFKLRKIYLEVFTYIYFFVIGLHGVYNYVIQNYTVIVSSIDHTYIVIINIIEQVIKFFN
jgi:hypothetical protein